MKRMKFREALTQPMFHLNNSISGRITRGDQVNARIVRKRPLQFDRYDKDDNFISVIGTVSGTVDVENADHEMVKTVLYFTDRPPMEIEWAQTHVVIVEALGLE